MSTSEEKTIGEYRRLISLVRKIYPGEPQVADAERARMLVVVLLEIKEELIKTREEIAKTKNVNVFADDGINRSMNDVYRP